MALQTPREVGPRLCAHSEITHRTPCSLHFTRGRCVDAATHATQGDRRPNSNDRTPGTASDARFVVYIYVDPLRRVAEPYFLSISGTPNPQRARVKLCILQCRPSQHPVAGANWSTLRYHKMLGAPTVFSGAIELIPPRSVPAVDSRIAPSRL